jgi:hypothetical protein
MSDWKDLLRERLAHLPDAIREGTIAQVIADTESGRPFASVTDTPKAVEEPEQETPAETDRPVPRPGKGPGRAW